MQQYNIVVSDTSCMILLQKIEALEILHQLYLQVFTTPQVRLEYKEILPEWVNVKSVKDVVLLSTLNEAVDLGEASAIVLAIEIPGSTILIDDLKGRKLAKRLGLNFMGVLGMLLKAKENNLITSVRAYTDRIQKTDFWISENLINYVLEQAGE